MKHALQSLGLTASTAAALLFSSYLPQPAAGAVPVVRTVPWVAGQPGIPHETYAGKSITLKGVTNLTAPNFHAKWRFGDGTPDALFVVTDLYDVSTTHMYTGPVGKRWSATLTVIDAETGDTSSAEYNVVMREDNLATRMNVAMDEGLWYLHRTLQRYVPGVSTQGDWDNLAPSTCNPGDQACDNRTNSPAINASNVLAFELNGHLGNSAADNPYAEDVARALARMFGQLTPVAIPSRSNCPGNSCSFNPDGNGNGWAVFVVRGENAAQTSDPTGQFIDAFVASGTPNAKVMSGPEHISGRTYKEIVQDLVDGYSYCRFSAVTEAACPKGPRPAARWATAGLAAAMKAFGITVPQAVMQADQAELSSPTQPANPADRYAMEISQATPGNVILKSLVDSQNPVGFWAANKNAADDRPFETAWSIIMLRRGSFRK